MNTTINQPQFQTFLDRVKEGKFEGLIYGLDEELVPTENGDFHYLRAENERVILSYVDMILERDRQAFDMLCGFLRRWLTSKGYGWVLFPNQFSINWESGRPTNDGKGFMEGSEVDQVISACLYVLDGEK